MTEHEELKLFKLIAEGNERAFSEVFHEYNSRLFMVVLKITKSESEAEEIIQNVFLKLWLNRHKLHEIENPGAWLYKVASNLALSFLRSKATQLRHEKVLQCRQLNPQDDIQLQLEAKEIKNLVSTAIEGLPPGRREVYILSRHEGLNRMEIASRLGITESTVKNQLGSALKFIQQYINQRNGVSLPVIVLLLF